MMRLHLLLLLICESSLSLLIPRIQYCLSYRPSNRFQRSSSVFKVHRHNHHDPTIAEVQPVIVGTGPAGLATAIMLAREGFSSINLYDQHSEPPAPNDTSHWGAFSFERNYNIGLSGRGQKVLKGLGAMQRVKHYCALAVGRVDWAPRAPVNSPKVSLYTERRYTTHCIERDRLAACLVQEIREKYAGQITLHFDTRCIAVKWSDFSRRDEKCTIHLRNAFGDKKVTTTLLIGADGSRSLIRDQIMNAENAEDSQIPISRRLRAYTYTDTNKFVYRTIPLHIPDESLASEVGSIFTSTVSPMHNENRKTTDGSESFILDSAAVDQKNAVDREVEDGGGNSHSKDLSEWKAWRKDVNYSARRSGELNFDALPTKEGVFLGVVIYRPGDSRLDSIRNSADARLFFQTHFPMFVDFIRNEDFQRFSFKKDSNFPTFSYVGPKLHHGHSTVLIGDSIHTVKPYFGLGLNSALEDVIVLRESLRHHIHTGMSAKSTPLESESKSAALNITQTRVTNVNNITSAHGNAKQGSDTVTADSIKIMQSRIASKHAKVNIAGALSRFTLLHKKDTQALVEVSHRFDGGFLWFVLPLIIDTLCHRILPAIFERPTLALMQNEQRTFSQVKQRKQRDRIVQSIVAVGIVGVVAKFAFMKLIILFNHIKVFLRLRCNI